MHSSFSRVGVVHIDLCKHCGHGLSCRDILPSLLPHTTRYSKPWSNCKTRNPHFLIHKSGLDPMRSVWSSTITSRLVNVPTVVRKITSSFFRWTVNFIIALLGQTWLHPVECCWGTLIHKGLLSWLVSHVYHSLFFILLLLGGGVLAHTIVGVDFNELTGEVK